METEDKIEEIWPKGDTRADAFLFEQGAVMRAAKAALQRQVGLSAARLRLLGTLFMHRELSQAELQRRLDVDGAAVTRQVKQLEAEGLVTRRVDPDDNRFTLVTLTSDGKAQLREATQRVKMFIQDSLEGVSEEDMACMQRVMAHIRANLEKL
jgi:DNA-binding MarR family transcriptional regulator